MSKKISIVVPMYNEEEVIEKFYSRIKQVLSNLKYEYELIIVNDGSRDKTLEIALKIQKDNDNIKILNFSRNFGHQAAITAGIENAIGDAIVTIDADLQDPPEIILDLINEWEKGTDIVYAKRKSRNKDKFFKRKTAEIYYKILNKLSEIEIPENVGDYRLISKQVQEVFVSLPEKERYVRGLFAWMGFKTNFVEFDRDERCAGKTKYTLSKMIKLAISGIVGFSTKPLKMIFHFGCVTILFSIILSIYAIIMKIIGNTIWDWTLLVIIVTFLGGIQLISLGIVSQYIAKIYNEIKGRPAYIIMDKFHNEKCRKI